MNQCTVAKRYNNNPAKITNILYVSVYHIYIQIGLVIEFLPVIKTI
jgi:hypothetical protein